ncbi:MAG: hypothetical protein ABIT70_02390 [Sulfuriferula sp.]
MGITEDGFVVTAGRNGHWFFRSFHKDAGDANRAARKTIDVDALRVVEAAVAFAPNGNVRLWIMVPNA